MQVVDKWIDIFEKDLNIKCNRDIVYKLYKEGNSLELIDDGFALCHCFTDILGHKICSEIMIYLKPDSRNMENFKELVDFVENTAKEQGCDFVQLGAFTGYQDKKIIKMYQRLGYDVASVRKEL